MGEDAINSEDIIRVAKHFKKVHHTPGRLRVRVSLSILKEKSGDNKHKNSISLDDILSLPKKINGLKSIKINKLMLSATIEYDESIFEPSLWDDLIDGKNTDKIVSIINKLSKDLI